MSGGRRIKKPAPKAKAGAAAKASAAAMPAGRPKAKAVARPAEPAMDLAVGRRIRELRREHKLSLETIADRTDLSIGFLSQIEFINVRHASLTHRLQVFRRSERQYTVSVPHRFKECRVRTADFCCVDITISVLL